jgi:ABC-type nitrate/sulfonate/bicarbonate transport system substrate-binding protein
MSEDSAAFEAFLLGLRIFYQLYASDAPASEFERPWEVLTEVAAGRMTLTNTGDLAARYPEMAEFLYERVNRIVASDRANAERVLRGLQESLQGRPAAG